MYWCNLYLCFDTVELKLIVNPLPDIQLKPEYYFCMDNKTGAIISPAILNTGITASNYVFEWTHVGIPYGGNTSSISASQIGNYAVKVTNTNTNCINTYTSKVLKYSLYLEVEYSEAFITPAYITVTVLGDGTGNYEYQLDDSPFQDSNTFNNVSLGKHTITVIDKGGNCYPITIDVVLINYPRYFTPNGDGYHETWNIPYLELSNPNAPIHIYDRYGKLIKELSPSSNGWNGMYNGQPLPSSDYWFTVEYLENGIPKIFKSHFTLKR